MAVATPAGGYSDWNLVGMPTSKCVTILAERQEGALRQDARGRCNGS
ncbi:hypothetical protein RSAG8_13998, partial [Rhizoctonia solani AG-8 WAC10335]